MTPLPPKQGLKLPLQTKIAPNGKESYDTTSTKTRIETTLPAWCCARQMNCYDTTSTKTRIETTLPAWCCARQMNVMTPLPPKQGLKLSVAISISYAKWML